MKTSMVALCLLVAGLAFSQESNEKLKINDEWFDQVGSKGLQVGDAMPDIPLGTVVNNKTGKLRFSDFKGKLVILDFWNTYCSSCISLFPHMEELQRKFEGKVQIFLVNIWETENEIQKRLQNYRYKVQMPDLPSIVAGKDNRSGGRQESKLGSLFPTRGVPHHVWINGNGRIILRGGMSNTYAQKIQDALDGKDIFVLNNSATIPSLSKEKKFISLHHLFGSLNSKVSFGSFITGYNNEVDFGGGGSRQLEDSSSGIRITQFFNEDLLEIYLRGPFRSYLNQFGQKGAIIYAPSKSHAIDLLDFSKEIDKSKYTQRTALVPRKGFMTDKDILKSKFCYEQIIPIEVPEETAREYMARDLNNYFSFHYGTIVESEKRKMRCFILVRSSDYKSKEPVNRGDKASGASGTDDLQAIIGTAFRNNQSLNDLLLKNKITGKPFLILNETGWGKEKQLDIEIPVKLESIDELRAALQKHGLDIVEGERELSVLVIKSVSRK